MKFCIFILSLISFSSFSQNCDVSTAHLTALFKISESTNGQPKQKVSHFNMYRKGHSILHEYPEQKMAHHWYQMKNKKVSLTRYFLSDKRGIEYQPQEINNVESWQQKQQLLLNGFIEKFSKIAESGEGCFIKQTLTHKTRDSHFDLIWYPALKLVKSLHIVHANHKQEWQLAKLDFKKEKIAAKFKELSTFETTDYSDIGDNEADPFLTTMIQQGFKTDVISKVNQSANASEHHKH